MRSSEIQALLPLIIMAGTAVTVMLIIALRRNHILTALATISGLLLALFSLPVVYPSLPLHVTTLLIIDQYAFFYTGLILAATIVTAVFSYVYLEKRSGVHEEFYLLLLLSAIGAAVIVASGSFVSIFLGIEILSVSLYALLAYLRSNEKGMEAGMKYLVLAGASSAFLLFGMALVYSELGTMEIGRLVEHQGDSGVNSIIFISGTVFIIAGLGFKLGFVPFHMWTPDVYEGAPAPITGFVATVSKGAVFALLLRYLGRADVQMSGSLLFIFTLIASASMFVGNFLALLQNNVKRMLAYSSIAHIGYLLVAFLASGTLASTAVAFYLVAYFVTTLAAFGIINILSSGSHETESIDDYRSLAWHRPWIAGVFTTMLLSLAGIPLTAGFLGKFYVLAAGVQSALWFLVIMLVINSAVGLFYYLRVILIMFQRAEKPGEVMPAFSAVPLAGGVMLAALTLILIWLGVYPVPLIQVIQKMAVIH